MVRKPDTDPEELLRDFGILVDTQPQSLRHLAERSRVGAETIRGWKDKGHFPRNGEDFLRVVRTCLSFIARGTPVPATTTQQWEIRYGNAKTVWEKRDNTSHTTAISGDNGRQPAFPSVHVSNGDYVNRDKSTVHIGNINHHNSTEPQH